MSDSSNASMSNTDVIDIQESGRIDAVLSRLLPHSRNQIQQWIAEGRVQRDGEAITDKSLRVEPGQTVRVNVPQSSSDQTLQPEDEPLEVLYEDGDVLAVNKPSGVVVHPTRVHTSGTLVHRLLHHYPECGDVGPEGRAGLVHRLDRGTSGVLLVARNSSALKNLQGQFRRREVKKTYRAILSGVLDDPRVKIEVPVGRHSKNPTLRRAQPTGKYALTRIERAGTSDSMTAAWCYPETGRTHQIRVHCDYIGHPVIGDRKYGGDEGSRLMLHAERIECTHPTTGNPLTVEAPCPGDFLALWNQIMET